MKGTIKEKFLLVRDFILTRGKIVFPILLVVAVAITVAVALKERSPKVAEVADNSATLDTVSASDVAEIEVPDVPFELNAYPQVNELILAYFTARAAGDADTIEALQGSLDNMERIKIVELGKYIENYSTIDVYTKPGPIENSYIAIAYMTVVLGYYPEDALPGYETFYICPREDGTYYINQEDESEEVLEYIRKVMLQDDVVELCNKITVECNDVYLAKPELLNYMSEIEKEVKEAAGEILAQQQVSGNDVASNVSDGDVTVSGNEVTPEPEPVPEPEPAGPIYATATTTVNVRSSDSATADKLGKVSGGTKVEIIGQLPNGWSKIDYEGQVGYIKSEYLNVAENVDDVQIIGTVTATANVNVRAAASQNATKLGVAIEGDTLDLIAREGDWCKVVYDGQVGYIKAEFVE